MKEPPLWDVIKEIGGMIIADKGLIGKDYQDELFQHTGINLHQPSVPICRNLEAKNLLNGWYQQGALLKQ